MNISISTSGIPESKNTFFSSFVVDSKNYAIQYSEDSKSFTIFTTDSKKSDPIDIFHILPEIESWIKDSLTKEFNDLKRLKQNIELFLRDELAYKY